jgi:ADP-ribose pyrophosphatase YjhB (NUDIX family)
MPAITVNVAVIHENKILLTQRDDFEVWCLPSGGVEDGESIAQAAIRETKEETGLDVELTSLVGIYSRLGDLANAHAVLFSAKLIGGNIRPQTGETIDVHFYPFDEIPENLSFGHRKRIEDAKRGIGGSTVVTQEMVLPDDGKIKREDIIQARNLTREARLEFFQRTMGQAQIKQKTEVGESE